MYSGGGLLWWYGGVWRQPEGVAEKLGAGRGNGCRDILTHFQIPLTELALTGKKERGEQGGAFFVMLRFCEIADGVKPEGWRKRVGGGFGFHGVKLSETVLRTLGRWQLSGGCPAAAAFC